MLQQDIVTASEPLNFPLRHLSDFWRRNDPWQKLRPSLDRSSPGTLPPHTHSGTLEYTCLIPQSQVHAPHLLCLFNLCQVSQDHNFPKPFPQIRALAQTRHQKEAEETREFGLALHGCPSHHTNPHSHPRTPMSPALSHSIPRPRGALTYRQASHTPGRCTTSADHPSCWMPGVPSRAAGIVGRHRAGQGRAVGSPQPPVGARPGGSAPSLSERASRAGGAICNRADATTAPYSRGAGAGGQVTAAHPPPPSRVVPAREEPPGAL